MEIPREKKDRYRTTFRFFNLGVPTGTPTLVPYLPFFWTWAFFKLLWYRPNVVHACDLQAMPPCYLYKRLFRDNRKLVFDVFDRFAMNYIPYKKNFYFRWLYSFTNSVEERLAEGADVLISVSEEFINTFRRKPKKCVPIMNCSEDYYTEKLETPNDSTLKLAFTGHIRRDRGLELLPSAIKDLADVHLVVTGRLEDEELMSTVKLPNITYLGFLEHGQVITVEINSDAMVALYNPNSNTQNKYVVGNKLFEAMMCGTPIITNVATEIVNETQCGIVVEYDVEKLSQAIRTLRDNPEMRKKLGDNGRKAFLQKYNWAAMEQRLYDVYKDLI